MRLECVLVPVALGLCGVAVIVAGASCDGGNGDVGSPIGSSTLALGSASAAHGPPTVSEAHEAARRDPNIAAGMVAILAGQDTFRFDTFGDEAFWGDALKLHQAIEGRAHGGIGDGVSPRTALAVGLKVDATALPAELVTGIESGRIDLDDPATTLALLELNAVVGVRGTMNPDGSLRTIGIQCALCHSTVDDSLAPGIGRRLDGWANRDLDVGAIVNLSPDLTPVATLLRVDEASVRTVLHAWGPGKFDAQLFLDGKATRPDGKSAATLIPPAFGLAGVNLHTYEGWGSVPYWNAFVAVLEMHGQGNFTDTRLDDAVQYPVAARNKSGHTHVENDLVSSKLPGLHVYQLALPAPLPPKGSFDATAARRGETLFGGAAKCASCHTEPTRSEPGWNMHTPAEIGIDDFQSSRSPDKRYRTTPLRGLWSHQKGGFYHDGRFPTLVAVMNHYDATFALRLTNAQKSDVIEYLKSL